MSTVQHVRLTENSFGACFFPKTYFCMVWYGMVNVDLYSAIITKVSNALYLECIYEAVQNGILTT